MVSASATADGSIAIAASAADLVVEGRMISRTTITTGNINTLADISAAGDLITMSSVAAMDGTGFRTAGTVALTSTGTIG